MLGKETIVARAGKEHEKARSVTEGQALTFHARYSEPFLSIFTPSSAGPNAGDMITRTLSPKPTTSNAEVILCQAPSTRGEEVAESGLDHLSN